MTAVLGRSQDTAGPATPVRPRRIVDLPVIAAGGLATADDVAATIRAGADAIAVGTRPAAQRRGRHLGYP